MNNIGIITFWYKMSTNILQALFTSLKLFCTILEAKEKISFLNFDLIFVVIDNKSQTDVFAKNSNRRHT